MTGMVLGLVAIVLMFYFDSWKCGVLAIFLALDVICGKLGEKNG